MFSRSRLLAVTASAISLLATFPALASASADSTITTYSALEGSKFGGPTLGTDGNFWMISTKRLLRFEPTGNSSAFPLNVSLTGANSVPPLTRCGNNLWTETAGQDDYSRLLRIGSDGAVQQASTPAYALVEATPGNCAHSRLWFTIRDAAKSTRSILGSIGDDGAAATYPGYVFDGSICGVAPAALGATFLLLRGVQYGEPAELVRVDLDGTVVDLGKPVGGCPDDLASDGSGGFWMSDGDRGLIAWSPSAGASIHPVPRSSGDWGSFELAVSPAGKPWVWVGNHAVKRHLAFLTLAEDGTVVRRRFKLSKAPSTRCASGAGDSVGFDSKGNLWTAGQESLAVVHPGGNAELWCAADLIQHVRPSIPTVGPDGNFWFRSWMGLQRINVADPSPYRCLLTLARRQKAARRSIVRGALRCSGSVNAVISGEAFVSDAGGRWRYSLRSARIKLRAGREKSIKIRIVRPSGSIALRGLLSTRRRAALYPEATIAGPYGAKTSVKRTWEGWL